MTFTELLHEYFTTAQSLELVLRIVISCLCGLVIGIERSSRFKPAGLRTHMIVCCAAALFMIVSKYGFADLGIEEGFFAGTKGADPSRIAAGIATGIGFIGAGAIFKSGDTVRGLTTAAGVWATSAVGLCIGAGMYIIGIASTVIIIITQFALHKVSFGGDAYISARVSFTTADETVRSQFLKLLLDNGGAIKTRSMKKHGDGSIEYDYFIRIKDDEDFDKIIEFLDNNSEVISYYGGEPL